MKADTLPPDFRLGRDGYISETGWLAVGDQTGQQVAVVNLRDLAATATVLRPSVDRTNVAWGSDGRLAVRGDRETTIFDPIRQGRDRSIAGDRLLLCPPRTFTWPGHAEPPRGTSSPGRMSLAC